MINHLPRAFSLPDRSARLTGLLFCIFLFAPAALSTQPVQLPADSIFQVEKSSETNVEFFTTNHGPFGLDVENLRAGGIWPAGSRRRYLYGGGFWFGARKYNPNTDQYLQLATMSYNPNSGLSWFVPGRAANPTADEPVDTSADGIALNRLYNSLDHETATGEDTTSAENLPLWPLWSASDGDSATLVEFGSFVPAASARVDRRSEGWVPSFLGSQSFFSIMRDNDLDRYEIGRERAAEMGFPLGLEVQSYIVGWGVGRLKDVVLQAYAIVNRSADTLRDCYFALAYDIDIGDHRNDRLSVVIPEREQDTLRMAQMWSEATVGDQGYGYLGIDFLVTPAVDAGGYLRKERTFYPAEAQIGLATVRNWVIDIDPQTVEDRYRFISSGDRDGDNGASDKRMLVSSGPFHMIPGDTARFVVGLLFAEATTSLPSGVDNENLVDLSSYVQGLIDEAIRSTNSVKDEPDLFDLIRALDLR